MMQTMKRDRSVTGIRMRSLESLYNLLLERSQDEPEMSSWICFSSSFETPISARHRSIDIIG